MQKLFLSTAFILAFSYYGKAEELLDTDVVDQEIVQEDLPPVLPNDSYGTVDSRLNQLEAQVQKLTDKIEVLEHRLKVKNETMMAPIAPSLGKKPSETLSEALTPTTSDATTLRTDDAQTLYAKAQEFLALGEYDTAENALKELIKSYPKDPLVINAKYWLGETYYVQGDYRRASVSFGEAYKSYKMIEKSTDPKDKEAKKLSFAKAPEALIKLVFSLKGLGKTDAACATLDQLQEEFPNQAQNVKKMVEKAKKDLTCSKK
ncbi:MAG: tetratricopeptide repeat protein [Candidatus Paracaedimonas acanthamoebae]|mgnify:CR=1 FL=1|uniref:Tetratricopeptide repeat protein n=1 Tax=Candidatus Paracaedimonas acanthamoebae TaxID=244581 RepID=A0A8J7PY93_9PROT|nr:tetratricopeptide repeat protein [Candidatus Paracaedimonas acanthamoebae]